MQIFRCDKAKEQREKVQMLRGLVRQSGVDR